MQRAVLGLAIVLAACHDAAPPPAAPSAPAAASGEPTPPPVGPPPPTATADSSWACEPLPFAASTPLPEASGAAWLAVDGAWRLLVIADSGNDGDYALIDPDTGATVEQGQLPLGDAGDDLEGVATADGRVYALTSGGWMRAYVRRGHGFALVDGPYPIGDRHGRDMCGRREGNCKRDFEGLCLAAHPRGPCVGFALAKHDGVLRCLARDRDGRLALADVPAIRVGFPEMMADCAFDDADGLWVGANGFGLGAVVRVFDWDDPGHARVAPVASITVGFAETIAARGDVVYRMSDTGGAPSLMAKFRCRPDGR